MVSEGVTKEVTNVLSIESALISSLVRLKGGERGKFSSAVPKISQDKTSHLSSVDRKSE